MGYGWLLLASRQERCGRVRFSSWYARFGERQGVILASSGSCAGKLTWGGLASSGCSGKRGAGECRLLPGQQ